MHTCTHTHARARARTHTHSAQVTGDAGRAAACLPTYLPTGCGGAACLQVLMKEGAREKRGDDGRAGGRPTRKEYGAA